MEKLVKYGSGPMHRGISPRTPDFQPQVELSTDTFNLTHGMEQGLAVRHGLSPIPGQNDNETATLNPRFPGLLMSEGAPSIGLQSRVKVLGWVQLSLPDPADITKNLIVYGVAITAGSGGTEYLDICLCSRIPSSSENVSANIFDGFGPSSLTTYVLSSTDQQSFLTEGIITDPGNNKENTLKSATLFDATRMHASIATINVSGADIAMQWMYGQTLTTGDATHAPNVGFFRVGLHIPSGTTAKVVCGIPTEYQLGNYKTAQRSMKIYALTNHGDFNIAYSLLVTPSAATFFPDILEADLKNLDVSGITATKDSAGTAYGSSLSALVDDPAATSNSSYTAVAIAAAKPYLSIFQGAFRCNEGKFNQWFDLTQNMWQPPALNSDYEEDFNNRSTCFARWPGFVTSAAMIQIIGPYGPDILGAGTGVLRAKTAYEFTYSLYNKRLNFETNVGPPVRFNTGTNDFVGLQLWWGQAGGNPPTTQYFWWENTGMAGNHWMPFHFSDFQDDLTGWWSPQLAINFCQYRFYYRQYGTFEWLPAGNIDAAQFWFDAFLRLNVCTGPVAATPGGQPGGTFDYSPLPTDNYKCVVQYKNRFFWFSDKACVFSLPNNIFAYPATCSISASTGKFLGAIVHNYPGQAEQSSRLIIFGTEGNYVARFSGSPQLATVQVSADTSAEYPIQGSDLIIDPWTSVTAFSFRSAVVASGILYYWGPMGVYRDDGVATPSKISLDLEPYIFTLYDPNDTDQIHSNYDDLTKEITWHYKPKVSDGFATHALVYDIITGEFLPGKIKAKVDWVQNLNIASNIGTAGNRTVAGIRETASTTIQRSYFSDNRNRSGDMAPKSDWLIKTISTPSAGIRRLTLAAGYDATNFATIAVGDYLALQQTKLYDSSLTLADDLIAKIAVVNTGSGYLDITLPTGASLDGSASPTFNQYFPFWTMTPTAAGLNGIPYQMKTVYWVPGGTNGYFFWLYWYLLAKYTAWKTDLNLGWNLGYRSPTSTATLTDHVVFSDNSDGNFQIYHPLAPGNDNHEGQGLKLTLSGNHIGPEWVLQYMEIHGMPRMGDMLKRFEG